MEYELVVESASYQNRINALQLSDFLKNFRSAYVVALAFLEYENISDYGRIAHDEEGMKGLENSFRRFISASGMLGSIASLSRRPISDDLELDFVHITTNSPIKFIGYCTGTSLVALALAVALAGGEADLRAMKFKVNPLLETAVKIARELRP
jgi:hypothetical protein